MSRGLCRLLDKKDAHKNKARLKGQNNIYWLNAFHVIVMAWSKTQGKLSKAQEPLRNNVRVLPKAKGFFANIDDDVYQ